MGNDACQLEESPARSSRISLTECNRYCFGKEANIVGATLAVALGGAGRNVRPGEAEAGGGEDCYEPTNLEPHTLLAVALGRWRSGEAWEGVEW